MRLLEREWRVLAEVTMVHREALNRLAHRATEAGLLQGDARPREDTRRLSCAPQMKHKCGFCNSQKPLSSALSETPNGQWRILLCQDCGAVLGSQLVQSAQRVRPDTAARRRRRQAAKGVT